jgi:hypothetical protein
MSRFSSEAKHFLLDVKREIRENRCKESQMAIDSTADIAQERARAKLDRLIAERGVTPLTREDIREMGDLWPEGETVDEFLKAVREWRSENHDRTLS